MIILDDNKEWVIEKSDGRLYSHYVFHAPCRIGNSTDTGRVFSSLSSGWSYLGYNLSVAYPSRYEQITACQTCFLEMPWKIQDKMVFIFRSM